MSQQSHGDFEPVSRKWYCQYWMTSDEWLDVHDYAPPDKDEKESSTNREAADYETKVSSETENDLENI